MAVDPAIGRIVERVRAGLPETIERSVSTTFHDVPAYPASPSPTLRTDLRAHTETVFEAVLNSMAEGRPASRSDFPITAQQAILRVRAGVALSDFLQGFRIGQVSLWEAIVAASNPERTTRDAAVDLAIHVMRVIEVGSAMAAEAYMEAQQADLAEGDRLSRDVIDDLVAGRTIARGSKAELLAAAGLEGDVSIVVVVAGVARPLREDTRLREVLSTVRSLLGAGERGIARPLREDTRLREVLSTVRSLLGAGERGIATIRQDDIVGVVPASGAGGDIVSVIERAERILRARGVEMGVGVSTPHRGVAAVPEAHREALIAWRSLRGDPGVRPLAGMRALEYLALVADETAARLVRPEVRAFVEEDRASGGTQAETLRVYAESDLNAKTAAERLHVHVNTAYYRIDQIAERTGCDPRRFRDLQDLLLAVRLLDGGTSPS